MKSSLCRLDLRLRNESCKLQVANEVGSNMFNLCFKVACGGIHDKRLVESKPNPTLWATVEVIFAFIVAFPHNGY